MELTSKKYWEEYYELSSEDSETIRRVCGRYDNFYEMMIDSCRTYPTSLLEIGAFPGRYLAYISSKYGLKATGLDFNPDVEKFNRSMRSMGVEDYKYVNADFLTYTSSEKYDLIFSNGFVEHFTDFDLVLDRHAQCLNLGGAMLLMIPNKRYLRSVYGDLLDYRNQRAHNLDCMRLDVFRKFAERNQLSIRYLSYHGGFPYRVHTNLHFWQRVIYHPVRFLSLRLEDFFRRFPSKYWSGTIIGVFSSDK